MWLRRLIKTQHSEETKKLSSLSNTTLFDRAWHEPTFFSSFSLSPPVFFSGILLSNVRKFDSLCEAPPSPGLDARFLSPPVTLCYNFFLCSDQPNRHFQVDKVGLLDPTDTPGRTTSPFVSRGSGIVCYRSV